MILIYTILSLLSIILCVKRDYAKMFFCLTSIMYGIFGFSLVLGDSPIKEQDFLLVSLFIMLIIEYGRDKSFFSTKNDKLGKIVGICFLWTFIIFVGTVVLGVDSFYYAFKMYRPYFILIGYFLLRKMNTSNIEEYLKYIFVLSVLQGIFFYLQLVGVIGVLAGYGAIIENGESLEEHRFGNFPYFYSFFFLYTLFKGSAFDFKKLFWLIFWGMMPIIGQMRSQTILLVLSAVVYFIINRKSKYLIYIVFFALSFQFIITPMFQKRASEGDIGTFEEISMVVNNMNNIYDQYAVSHEGGTFAFRIAMLAERVMFVIDNPQYLLTGVGCIHENSQNQKFVFKLATYSPKLKYGASMLSSADSAWIGVLMHFGIIGVVLFMTMYLSLIYYSIPMVRGSTNLTFIVYACMTISLFVSSFNGETIGQVTMLSLMFVFSIITIQRKDMMKVNH